jgi:hypothetical protein
VLRTGIDFDPDVWRSSTSHFKKKGPSETTGIRKRERQQKKKTKCSNPWCRQEGHNKRSCRTVNDSRVLAEREESDIEAEAEAIVVDVPIRRTRQSRTQKAIIDV